MKIILSSRNPSKALQIQTLFSGSRIQVLTLSEAGVEGEAVEDGETLYQNALKKAQFAHDRAKAGFWAMADDTGLFIDALKGEPGVRSARWAGENATTEEITNYCLERLKGAADRSATFQTVVSLISPDGKSNFFVGELRGRMLEAARLPAQPKMPYSPLFVPEGEELCFAEMSTSYENEISHRGKAFGKVREFLLTS